MALMEWNSELDVGVQKMNDEHKDILEVMNQLYDAKLTGKSGPDVIGTVEKLGRITSDHFASEEAYMESINYPEINSHKLIHKSLLEKYTQHYEEIKRSNGKMNDAFFHFLKLWLTAHIKGIDMKYSAKNKAFAKAG